MENATKALLMAGGVLLVMLIISLVLYAWTQYTEYYSEQEELADIEDLTEFNLQFTNYDRDDVTGAELLSLINKVIDYNERFSSVGTNDEGYSPITIEVTFNNVNNIIYETSGTTGRLFSAGIYIQSGSSNQLYNIFNGTNGVTTLENDYGKENLQNLAKSIDTIFTDNYTAEYRVNKFNSITSSKYASSSTIINYYERILEYANSGNYDSAERYIANFKDTTYKYYEYVQFKKAIFKSTSIDYDDNSTGRVISISFEYTGKVK